MPVKATCEMARARGIITLVDGAQGVGMLTGTIWMRHVRRSPPQMDDGLNDHSLLLYPQPY